MISRLLVPLAFAASTIATIHAAEASYTTTIHGNTPVVESNTAVVTGVSVRPTDPKNHAGTVTGVDVRPTDRTVNNNNNAATVSISVRQSDPISLKDDTIRQAVALWLDNPTAAEERYGGKMGLWNTEDVTNLDRLFEGLERFNENLNQWNTAKVTSMEYTFAGCTHFDRPLRGWDTSEVTSLKGTFKDASSFHQDLSQWQTTEVTDLSSTFHGASKFNNSLEGWDTSRVVTMERTFYGATFLEGSSLSNWNTGAVTNMQFMFSGATAFEGDITQWNTGSVETMTGMFAYTAMFDQDLSGWNMANVQFVDRMFYRALAFDQELCWDTLGPQVSGVELFCGSSGMLCDTQPNWPLGYEDNDDECPEAWQEMEEDEFAREGDGLNGQPATPSDVLDLQKYGGSVEGVGRGGSGGVGAMNPSAEALGRNHPESTAKLPADENDRPNDRAEGFVENVQVIPTPQEESADNGGGFATDALEEESSAFRSKVGLASLLVSITYLL